MTSTSLQDLPFHTALLTINFNSMHIMYVGSYVMEDIMGMSEASPPACNNNDKHFYHTCSYYS